MPAVTQYCVRVENKRGMLAKLCSVLRAAGINIQAIFVSEEGEGSCWVYLVATPAGEVDRVLTGSGYTYVPESVLTVIMDNRPGELERICDRLSEAGVNINYVYGGGAGGVFLLVLSVDNLDLASHVLSGEAPAECVTQS